MAYEEDVLARLDRVVRLLTILVTKDMTQREQVQLLSSIGLGPKEIATLIGTTPNTVSVTLSAIRRGGAKKKMKPGNHYD